MARHQPSYEELTDNQGWCIRCEEYAAVEDGVYCHHCTWGVVAETEQGIYELKLYLHRWAQFSAWERQQRELAQAGRQLVTVNP